MLIKMKERIPWFGRNKQNGEIRELKDLRGALLLESSFDKLYAPQISWHSTRVTEKRVWVFSLGVVGDRATRVREREMVQ